MKIETQVLHEGYSPKNGEPRVMPIYQSTTYVYNSTDAVADVFDDPTLGMIYSRFENPTTDAVEKKIAPRGSLPDPYAQLRVPHLTRFLTANPTTISICAPKKISPAPTTSQPASKNTPVTHVAIRRLSTHAG